jgi:hypothetical protein
MSLEGMVYPIEKGVPMKNSIFYFLAFAFLGCAVRPKFLLPLLRVFRSLAIQPDLVFQVGGTTPYFMRFTSGPSKIAMGMVWVTSKA